VVEITRSQPAGTVVSASAKVAGRRACGPTGPAPSVNRIASSAPATSPASACVEVRGLRTVLNGKVIFDGIDLDIERGRITAIMGPSGTGKTTLLRHITGQLAPDAGDIRVEGAQVRALRRGELFALREKIGYLFQNSALLTDFNVFENVAFPLRQHLRLPEELVRNIVLTRLQAVGLRGAAELMPAELSGGMARRVALARAIVRDPSLMIYDEPFVGLDPIALNQVLELIRTLNDSLGITSILVAHEFAAVRRVADHVYLIAGGKVVAEGHPDELVSRESPWTRQFFGGEVDGPVPFEYPARDYAADLGFPAVRA
jgi:phospholipid/cholesterol/gamma-HCH transport system ATP-binding protein